VNDDGKLAVYLVQQGIWNTPLESMPLAAGYLKSMALTDDRVRRHADIRIFNYGGGATLAHMANDLFAGGAPDVLACSVLGWNYYAFGSLAETFKQLNPGGWVVFGGPHIANQAERAFRMFPAVDVIVNGEGELVFRDLLAAHLDGTSPHALSAIAGISYTDSGRIVTTAPRQRIEDLDIIPSPVLTGAIELTDGAGRFRYDVALMETNRGCPYKCGFCYWGGAIGQRVRAFSRERLRQEAELFARLKVHTLVLCDANFGLLPIDEEFVDDLVQIKERYGYPRALDTSWAKNKSRVFYDIVGKMKRAGLRSSFTLALQTLNDEALRTMNRRNMKVNEWDDLVAWLSREGLDCYAELIWGAPGETVESFMAGYDRLARHVSRIAAYPLLLLPNTEYADKKKEYGIVAVRGDHDDFEYVLAHSTMSFEDNRRMQRFLFWTRVIADAAVLRHIWRPLRDLGGVTQSDALCKLDAWVEHTDDPAAAPLQAAAASAVTGTDNQGPAISFLYSHRGAKDLLRRWWQEAVYPLLPSLVADVLGEVFRYDLLTQPILRSPDGGGPEDRLQLVRLWGEDYYLRAGVSFRFDVPGILASLRAGTEPDLSLAPITLDLYYRTGAETVTTTTNSEQIVQFMAMTLSEVPRGPQARLPT
jgi:radical SAM superfamily enzyme YgiQ (UPF0313 family)